MIISKNVSLYFDKKNILKTDVIIEIKNTKDAKIFMHDKKTSK